MVITQLSHYYLKHQVIIMKQAPCTAIVQWIQMHMLWEHHITRYRLEPAWDQPVTSATLNHHPHFLLMLYNNYYDSWEGYDLVPEPSYGGELVLQVVLCLALLPVSCWNFRVRLAWRVNAAFGNASIRFIFGIYGSYFCSYSPLVCNPPPPWTCLPTFGMWFPTQTSLRPSGAIKNMQELSMFCTQHAWLVTGASHFVIGARRFRKPSCSRGSH